MRVKKATTADTSAKMAVLGLLPRLTQMLQITEKQSLNLHVLACIDQICEQFGKTDLNATYHVAEVISSDNCMGSPNQALRTLSLHCMASMVDILGNDFIPLLQTTINMATACLHDSLQEANVIEKTHNAAYALLIAVVDCIPFMFGKSALRKVLESSRRSATRKLSHEADASRAQFMQLAATKLELPVVLETASDTWRETLQNGFTASTHLSTSFSIDANFSFRQHLNMLKWLKPQSKIMESRLLAGTAALYSPL